MQRPPRAESAGAARNVMFGGAAVIRRPASLGRRATFVATLLLTLGLLGGCSDDAETPAAGPECTAPTPAVTLSGPTAVFDLTGVAEPTRVFSEGGFLVVNAVAEGDIPDLAIRFMDVVRDAGYEVAGSDDEGFEAEVFFAAGQIAAGQVILTESDCPGVVDVKITLLDDAEVLRDADPSGGPVSTPATS